MAREEKITFTLDFSDEPQGFTDGFHIGLLFAHVSNQIKDDARDYAVPERFLNQLVGLAEANGYALATRSGATGMPGYVLVKLAHLSEILGDDEV